jgi:hypothetical protein
MASTPLHAVCDDCDHAFSAIPARTVPGLGLGRARCPACGAPVPLPLAAAARVGYWLAFSALGFQALTTFDLLWRSSPGGPDFVRHAGQLVAVLLWAAPVGWVLVRDPALARRIDDARDPDAHLLR